MTLARLLLAALLICSLPAFSQDQEMSTAQIPANGASVSGANRNAAATPSEPWKIIPNPPSDLNSDSADHVRVDQFRLNQGPVISPWVVPLDADTTCYTMRSYVVARDSKDSESTHPAGYSTCQPASRYRVKTTVEGPVLLRR
jgi:hypothetical protein